MGWPGEGIMKGENGATPGFNCGKNRDSGDLVNMAEYGRNGGKGR